MGYKFKEGDRIRLTENQSESLPFLVAGATGTITRVFGTLEHGPEYFVEMDGPVGHEGVYDDDDLDYWVIAESKMEAEDAS